MGTITSSGLVSGLDTANIISQLLAIESRPRALYEQRNEVLRSQQVAFQDINARLLSLGSSAASFATTSLFSQTTAQSSNESVLTVGSGVGAVPGTYSFIVNRLVAAQQTITRGFQDANASPAAPAGGTLSFERGEARLDSQTRLSQLNGGDGINRGLIRVTDRSGATAIVDLSAVVTVDDVVDRINQATGVNVIAQIDGDGISVTDASGAATNDLIITDVGVSGTATSLGLAGNATADGDGDDAVLSGQVINKVGDNTLLNTLNDGKGVRSSAGNDLVFNTAGGDTVVVDISNALTLGDVFDQIDTASNGVLAASVNDDGTGIKITDTSGGGAGFTVASGNASEALADLGLVAGADGDGDGDLVGGRTIAAINSKLLSSINGGAGTDVVYNNTLTGTTELNALIGGAGLTTSGDALADITVTTSLGATVDLDLDSVSTVQELIDLVNTASGGVLALTVEDNKFRLTDTSVVRVNGVQIADANGSTAAAQLGLAGSYAVNTVLGGDTDPQGTYDPAAGLGTIRITNSAGAATDIDLTGAASVSEVLSRINDAGAGVLASLNTAGTGLKLTDTANGNGDLVVADVSGDGAASLQLAGTFNDGVADTGDLEYAYINGGTRIDDLGISRGQFTIRDSTGSTFTVDLTQGNEVTIQDVISEINSKSPATIRASVNQSGDGIVIEDLGPGTIAIQIEDDGSTTARDLGILGTASSPGANLDGSFERSITVTATDTLDDIALKINDANIGISASVINDGSPGAPFRLSLSAETAGTGGAFVFDDSGLGFNAQTLSRAQDAAVFYGGNDPSTSILIESKSNTLSSVIPGADITLLGTSSGPTQVTIARDDSSIVEGANGFVAAFNGLIETLDKYDAYDAETEQRGLLLGDSSVSQIRRAVYNAVINPNNELTGQFKSLAQIGIRVGAGAKLEIDQNKFTAALQQDREAVEALFNFEQFETSIDPVTGDETDVLIAQGIGKEIDKLLTRLTDSIDGTVQRQIDILDRQIGLNEDRIESFNERLDAKRARLESQFIAMERALAQLQDQSSSLGQIASLSVPNQNG